MAQTGPSSDLGRLSLKGLSEPFGFSAFQGQPANMTAILQDYPDTTPANITTAIEEHLANPKIPVTRICKAHNVSRATFYRHLGNLYPKAPVSSSPKAEPSTEIEVVSKLHCPLCGESYPVDSTDEELLRHLAFCLKADGHTKSDARRMLREMGCSIRSVQPHSTSTISESQQEITREQYECSKSGGSVLETITTEATDDLFYQAKFDEHGDVRPGWDYKTWLDFWWENVPKTSSKNCHTATKPHRPKRRQ